MLQLFPSLEHVDSVPLKCRNAFLGNSTYMLISWDCSCRRGGPCDAQFWDCPATQPPTAQKVPKTPLPGCLLPEAASEFSLGCGEGPHLGHTGTGMGDIFVGARSPAFS